MKIWTYRVAILLAGLLALESGFPPVAAAEDTLDLGKFSGKVVVLDFWASWCVPCRRSFPWLNRMHSRYADDGLVIIGVNLDQVPGDAADFLAQYPAHFSIHYDPHAILAEQFDVRGMPSSFVIGRDGQVAAQHLGFKIKQQDEYEAAIVAALHEEGKE